MIDYLIFDINAEKFIEPTQSVKSIVQKRMYEQADLEVEKLGLEYEYTIEEVFFENNRDNMNITVKCNIKIYKNPYLAELCEEIKERLKVGL